MTLIASQRAIAVSPVGPTAPTETGGEHPLGADDGKQQLLPPPEHKDVIPPPPTGDEGIYTDAPNPEAGHEKEVIPPPRQAKSPVMAGLLKCRFEDHQTLLLKQPSGGSDHCKIAKVLNLHPKMLT